MSILKSILGPSKDEIWGQIADDIGGDFIDGGFWGKDVLTYQHDEWQIILDHFTRNSNNSSTTYTRMRAPFINKSNLDFTIYRESFFTTIGKFFGMQDIEIGERFFDENFIIKGNNEKAIKQLLDSQELKSLIESFPRIYFRVKDDEGFFAQTFPKGVDELYFECRGIVKEKEVLYNLFKLFTLVLDRLVAIDIASIKNPRIKLE